MAKAKLYLQRRDTRDFDRVGKPSIEYYLWRTDSPDALLNRTDFDDSLDGAYVTSFCAKELVRVLGISRKDLPPKGKTIVSSDFCYETTAGEPWELSSVTFKFER